MFGFKDKRLWGLIALSFTVSCSTSSSLKETRQPDSINQAPVVGLWEAVKVEIGKEEMTPRVKWTRIKPDGKFDTGNGWLTNGDGTWDYDPEGSMISLTNETGFYDPFGPFEIISFTDSTMVWNRMEEAREVSVFYKKINDIPKALPDMATGIWDFESAQRMGQDISEEYDPTGSRFIFLRWDRKYIDFTNNGRTDGVWNIDAHRAVIDILYYDKDKDLDYWDIAIDGDRMTWTREGYGLMLTFVRLDRFPE